MDYADLIIRPGDGNDGWKNITFYFFCQQTPS